MLVPCPECGLPTSDKALSCPHCGYPLKPEAAQKPKRESRRKRLPNGFGQISEIKGRNLRNPFRAMICTGKTDTGRCIVRPLRPKSYFETYNDAYSALMEHHKNPYDLAKEITVEELYTRWFEEYQRTARSQSSIRGIRAAWKYCSPLYKMHVSALRARHMKQCVEEAHIENHGKTILATPNAKQRMKFLFDMMLDYALEYELMERNYARDFALGADVTTAAKNNRKAHISFTEDEISTLWGKSEDKSSFADMVLIQCYSGWRPQELIDLKLTDVDLEKGFMQGGVKTDAGRNRFVPVHSSIRNLILYRYREAKELGSEYLFNKEYAHKPGKTRNFNYDAYYKTFTNLRDSVGLDPRHKPHDPRKHFVTMAKKANLDEYAIKYIVGHAIKDITESVYTERDLLWLKSEIEKIK